jgi:predicted NAD/FAD-binding protein
MDIKPKKIAIVGAGVAGITAAHILQRHHEVTLIEKNHYVGGHTNTIVIDDGSDAGIPVDTGFIVMNDRTYPTLHKLLDQLSVPVRDSDMSFGFYCERSGLQYSGRGFNGIFADRRNLFRPAHWQMIRDVVRFNKLALGDLNNKENIECTLGEYVDKHSLSNSFRDDYLLPMGSSIWSTPASDMLEFPARTFLHFFYNHGLLTLSDRPQWQTVVGGSHMYLKAFLQQFKGSVYTSAAIKHITRNQENITIEFENQSPQIYDQIVLAVHADQVLPLLHNPTDEERALYSNWEYNHNHTVLHTDPSVMPPNPRAWASWNYTRENLGGDKHALSMSYHMNRLQGFGTQKQYFVTLNRKQSIKPEHFIREFHYTHPMFTQNAVQTQEKLKLLQGQQNTFYCGSYFGFGFHEDAVKSGVAVANAMGMDL